MLNIKLEFETLMRRCRLMMLKPFRPARLPPAPPRRSLAPPPSRPVHRSESRPVECRLPSPPLPRRTDRARACAMQRRTVTRYGHYKPLNTGPGI